MIGIFPVISQTPDRLVAGFNDSHLDFRVVVDVATHGAGRQVTATTLVKTHNRLGRTYLAIILPFHRLMVPRLAGASGGLKAAHSLYRFHCLGLHGRPAASVLCFVSINDADRPMTLSVDLFFVPQSLQLSRAAEDPED